MKKKSGKTANTDGGVKKEDEDQSQRFVEMADEVEVDEKSKEFKSILSNLKSDSASFKSTKKPSK